MPNNGDQVFDPPGEAGNSKDKLFLKAVCGGCFAVTVFFICLSLFAQYPFPTTFAALFFGVAVGVLIYVFVSPNDENSLVVGGLSIGGVTVVVVVFAFLFRDKIHEELNPLPSETIAELKTELAEKTKRLEELEARCDGNAPCGSALSDQDVLARVETANRKTTLGDGICRIFKDRKGPFNTTKPFTAMVRFDEDVAPGTFQYCDHRGINFNLPLELDRIVDGDQRGAMQFQPKGYIGATCGNGFDADIKLGCDAAVHFLTEAEAAGCTPSKGVLWKEGVNLRQIEMKGRMLKDEVCE